MDSHMESGSSFDSNPIPLGYYYPYWWDGNSIEHLVLLIVFRRWCLGQKGRKEDFLLCFFDVFFVIGFVRIAEDFWGEGGCEPGDSKCSLPSHAFQSEKHAHANTIIVIVTLIVITIVFVIRAHTIIVIVILIVIIIVFVFVFVNQPLVFPPTTALFL